jgi:hypothetical protein
MKIISSTIGVIFIMIIIIFLIFLIFIIIRKNRDNSSLYNVDSIQINPVSESVKQDCKSVRTTCNILDPNSCSKSCNEQQLSCIDMNAIGGSDTNNINGGGTVCLPQPISLSCDITKGGIYVWQGFGFADTQAWNCYCSAPDVYNGKGCAFPNPDFCSGGTIDTSKLSNKKLPNADICTCPPNTVKMFRQENQVPFCASRDPNNGGGSYGLAGNIFSTPDWRNITFRPTLGAIDLSLEEWARQIVAQLTFGDQNIKFINDVTRILNNNQPSDQHLYVLNKNMADNISSVGCLNVTNICNSMANCESLTSINFPDTNHLYDTYSYYRGDNLETNSC